MSSFCTHSGRRFDWFVCPWFWVKCSLCIRWSVNTTGFSPCLSRRPPRSLTWSSIHMHWTFSIQSCGLYTFAGYGRLYNSAMVWIRSEAAPLLLLCNWNLLSRPNAGSFLHHFNREGIRNVIILVYSPGHRVTFSLQVFGLFWWCFPAILLWFCWRLVISTNNSSFIFGCAISLVKIWMHYFL